MQAAAVRLIQGQLEAEGYAPGDIDGKLGSNTYKAVDQALLARNELLPPEWRKWSYARKTIACLQLFCTEKEIAVGPIDGYWGQQTDTGFETLAFLQEHGKLPSPWRDERPELVNPNNWPRQVETELNAFYGATGANQVKLLLPYPHRLAWDLRTIVHSFSCNARVHGSAERVLTRVFDHYGLERIRELRLDHWGGCLNVRKMRGGTKWSMHSWGIALDYDPDHNRLEWGRDRATFARPEYDAWWRLWEEEGWTSLGRSRNYDWMHVQAAGL